MTDQTIPGKTFKWDELPEFVRNALLQVAEDKSLHNPTFDITPGSNKGDGWCGTILRVIIEGIKPTLSTGVKQQLRVIAKLAPLSKLQREQMGSNVLFEREVHIYNEYLPTLKEFQVEKGISHREGLSRLPRCYFASFDLERDETLLIFEDLKKDNFYMWDRTKPMDYFHASKVMESLGRFHGLSMVLKKQNPNAFGHYKKYTDPLLPMLKESKDFQNDFDHYFDCALDAFSETETVPRGKLIDFKNNLIGEIERLVNPEQAEPYTVVTHGDCWVNNIMFRSGTATEPTQLAFIDFQIARYVSPALDLNYFLFTSIDKKLRDQHYEDLLLVYHNAYGDILRRCGENVNQVFPYDALKEHLKRYGRFGIAMAFMVLPAITVSSGEIPDDDEVTRIMALEDKENQLEYQELMKQYKESAKKSHNRIREVVFDAIQYGYI